MDNSDKCVDYDKRIKWHLDIHKQFLKKQNQRAKNLYTNMHDFHIWCHGVERKSFSGSSIFDISFTFSEVIVISLILI